MTALHHTGAHLAPPGIDDHLGPRAGRYFGEGYRRVPHRLRDVRVAGGHITARAGATYPSDWSRKGDEARRPHLSTVDVLVFAAWLAELHLAHALGLDPGRRREAVLSRVTIRAGSRPVEERLDDVPVSAAVAGGSPPGTRRATALDCRVGALTARCDVHHDPGVPRAVPGSYADAAELLGPDENRFYGAGFRARTLLVTDLALASDGPAARADVVAGGEVPTGGLDGASAAAASFVDALVVGIQLGQVLLYRLDGVARADTATLWMRRTVLERVGPARALSGAEPATAALARGRLLADARGRVWRCADVVARFGGIALRCSVAHALPR